jgi:hypothetical protein
MEKEDIIIRNAILHILDTSLSTPVLSDFLMDVSMDASDLFRSQIYRLAVDDDVKDCLFDEDQSDFFKALYGFSENDLTAFSRAASEEFFRLMKEHADIPDGDLFFITCQIEGTMYLAILKLGYRTAFVHHTTPQEDGQYTTIMRHGGVLPGAGSKPTEGVLINLLDYTLRVAEKKCEIDGKKQNYLSTLFLGCKGKLSQKAKMDIVTKTVEKVNAEFFDNHFEKELEAKSVLQSEIASDGAISLETLSEKIYPEHPAAREKLDEALAEYHLSTEEIRPKKAATTKKLEKQFLVTDTGIEINIPMDQYQDAGSVEFISNPDGTISVLIKNISHLSAK